jgi:hypothetical protein
MNFNRIHIVLFLYTRRGRRGSGGTEPLILNLGTDEDEWSASRPEDARFPLIRWLGVPPEKIRSLRRKVSSSLQDSNPELHSP